MDKPSAVALRCCVICGTTQQLSRCGKCKAVYYCSAAHQHMDWPAHRQDCRLLAKQKSNNKMQQLQQAATLGTSQANSLQSTAPTSCAGDGGDGAVGQLTTDLLTSINTLTMAGIESAIRNDVQLMRASNKSVILGTNETEILNSQAESVSQSNINGDGFYNNIETNINNSTDADSSKIQQPILYQHPQQQQQLEQQQLAQPPSMYYSNHNQNQIEKSSSYQIGRVDEFTIGNANERRYEDLCRNIINDMNQYGLSVVDDFLGMEKGLQILNEVHRMYSAGVFKDGQLVNNLIAEQDSRTIRGDKITWVKGVEPGCSNVGYLINQIDAVICRANSMRNNGKLGNYNIKERTKAMVACYPGSGSHYVMHVDNPNKDGRVITAIYYLNVNWDTKRSGGVLRIFPEHGDSVADIEPKFDRLIFFWSDKRNPHEVQPAHRTRYAITVWYFDANEREVALNRCKYKNNSKISPNVASTTATNNTNTTATTAKNANNSVSTNSSMSSSTMPNSTSSLNATNTTTSLKSSEICT